MSTGGGYHSPTLASNKVRESVNAVPGGRTVNEDPFCLNLRSQTEDCSMKSAKALLCLLAVLETTRSTSGTTKKAFSGRSVMIDIKYESGYEKHRKYLCKDPCNSNADMLISADLKNVLVSAARYSLFDNTSTTVITATICDLQLSDSGKYWIGVDIDQRVDSYNEFTLIVYPAPTTVQMTSTAAPSTPTFGTSPEATEETGSPVPSASSPVSHVKDALPVGVIVGATLGGLLLVILLVVLLLWMKKPKWKLTGLDTSQNICSTCDGVCMRPISIETCSRTHVYKVIVIYKGLLELKPPKA
ncbi:CMRF35-like molecule 5 [Erpetoichthys calabaricus]|uniref:CMRF35-like molecule 5 n=1 Tax=Erpetoichthys calabaricus TaxID=27687 RepID=UPI0022341E9E|nr:CMRF35-like molecule 5 [Erpetoichthys calabaricus]